MRISAPIILAALMALTDANAQDQQATANMINPEGDDVGTVTFTQTPSGMLHAMVEMTGLPPGPHGFHIHEVGECDAEGGFESAGGHYAGNRPHGVNDMDGPHPGDFPNVHVGQDGVLRVEYFSDQLTINGNNNPLLDDDGSAVVVHASPDDYASQPSGEAGERIACGVIQ